MTFHWLTDWLTDSGYFYFWNTKSDPRDLWPLRHLMRVMRRHDLTKKIELFWNFLELFWNIFGIFFELFLELFWNFFEIFLELFWNFFLELFRNFLRTFSELALLSPPIHPTLGNNQRVLEAKGKENPCPNHQSSCS